jgi:hypothetical protein
MVDLVKATQRKLGEAKFFHGLLVREREKAVRNEPEAFEYYLSAFLSAARSVVYLVRENRGEWFDTWLGGRPKKDNDFLLSMKILRDDEVHHGGAKTTVEMEWIPVVELQTRGRDHPAYGFYATWLPGTEPPKLGRPTHYLEFGGQQDVIATCKRCIDVLEELVQDFSEIKR